MPLQFTNATHMDAIYGASLGRSPPPPARPSVPFLLLLVPRRDPRLDHVAQQLVDVGVVNEVLARPSIYLRMNLDFPT